MAKTIVIAGHGPGISDAVARQFGGEGFAVALAARSADKLEAAAEALRQKGITAQAFPTDLGDPDAVQSLIAKAGKALGPVTVLHWNAYAGLAGDLTTAPIADLRTVLDVGVVGLVAAVQAALPDMKDQKNPAVLVTGGGFALYTPQVDQMAAQYNSMGLAVSKAAQHKLVGVLSAKLAPEGIYVGEVQVLGMVKGTAFDRGAATIEAQTIAAKFWELYTARKDTFAQVG
jgi:NADP-dependent 3-hydroxy acid dehydrogenase YdfG